MINYASHSHAQGLAKTSRRAKRWQLQSFPWIVKWIRCSKWVKGVHTRNNWVGMCGPLLKTLTRFLTKSANFPSLFMT